MQYIYSCTRSVHENVCDDHVNTFVHGHALNINVVDISYVADTTYIKSPTTLIKPRTHLRSAVMYVFMFITKYCEL